ncbi:GNAT family N-acetyltransferase [Leucobacter rhizosphaerae]|uniref:GNAT family N-acetyltransferase n=1 Tax=Leucobacter rhizosphaerae TaxID=2932245 RepID=A0ABY4FZU0_9MICO|nr:GNAT family N-acetyltransferase [Leucobacter rhizosphaerae]UOQ61778.1 GNAT family N-acetyltransferase [Leucobacter rhizosphaerae]
MTERSTPAPAPLGRDPRPATSADADAMAEVLADAFFDDPVWGPAFPDVARRREQARAYWRFVVAEALRFPDSLVAEDSDARIGAVAVWFPPGAAEIREESAERYDALVRDLLGEDAAAALAEGSGRFAEARPDVPHAYLTLLAVAPTVRGRGAGMALLASALRHFDAAGIPTYLESSNPANDLRYEALGYRPHGLVRLAGGQVVQTYWRDPA